MIRVSYLFQLLSLMTFGLCTLSASAGNAILIWPIDPKISQQDKATELWLENRGQATTLMQVRVLKWQQINGQEQFQTQQEVLASPPMVRVEPGKKQLIRLIKQTPPPAGQEAAYRVLLDEIPGPPQPGEEQVGVSFQMRYSVPLFVYGSGLNAADTRPQLSWKLVNKEGKQAIEIVNRGNGHARMSNVTIGGRSVADGLLGYSLANSSNTFPANFPISDRSELNIDLGNKQSWRGTSSAR